MRASTVLTFFVAFSLGAIITASLSSHAMKPTPTSRWQVVPLKKAERRVAPSGKASVQILARGGRAFLGLLKMDAGAKVPTHQDASEEYIHVLEGHGTITINGRKSKIAAGTTIYMPSKAQVSYENGSKPMVAIQVFAGTESAAKYDRWKKSSL